MQWQKRIGEFKLIDLDHQTGKNVLTRIARYVYVQIRISLVLTSISKDIDICILFMEPGTLLPIIMANY